MISSHKKKQSNRNFNLQYISFLMIRYSRLLGFDNNSFHPDDGEPTIFNGNTRPTAFPTTEPLRTIRITSNEKVLSVILFT
jgi:hypothetical protein